MMARVVRILLLLASPACIAAQALRLPTPTQTYPAGERATIAGFIVSRDSDEFLVRDETSNQIARVTITADTKISSPSGLFNLGHTPQPPSTLIPGLIISARGNGGSRGNLIASSMSFRERDLRVARQIAAGDVELRARERQTAAIAAANRDSLAHAKERARDSLDLINARISRLDAYDLRVVGTVYFAANSATLTEEGKAVLDDLVAKSRRFGGWVVEVLGYTDDSGSATTDQELSARRADVVAAYLSAAQRVPLWRIVSPIGFGSGGAVASNDSPEGRARNRRVELRVLVNRGLQTPVTTP